jgi:hypothetical protein
MWTTGAAMIVWSVLDRSMSELMLLGGTMFACSVPLIVDQRRAGKACGCARERDEGAVRDGAEPTI